LKQEKLTISQFAKDKKPNQPTMWRIAHKTNEPSKSAAWTTNNATGGQVTVRDMRKIYNQGA
jgi:hypothetical protein